ncbi:hypothetical protein QG37_02812 [Candidozyma auris]|uniref:Uncharacterized protein n=1 Tax=Candidozyma auris TaxID=498019 RepID=A0A0L0P2K6_CANAR|nr:hypothetical protein QG37_02812 [[Candida] auris]
MVEARTTLWKAIHTARRFTLFVSHLDLKDQLCGLLMGWLMAAAKWNTDRIGNGMSRKHSIKAELHAHVYQ